MRQQQYWHDTAPLVDFYERRGLLLQVPGSGAMEEVAQVILDGTHLGKKK